MYQRISGRFSSGSRTGSRRRGARDIDIEVATHRHDASVRSGAMAATRPTRIF
jgi:hypothetical protein